MRSLQAKVGTTVVKVLLSRGSHTYAIGGANVKGTSVRLTLRQLRAIRHGRYTLIVVATTGRTATVRQFTITA